MQHSRRSSIQVQKAQLQLACSTVRTYSVRHLQSPPYNGRRHRFQLAELRHVPDVDRRRRKHSVAARRQSHVRLLDTVERVHGQAGDEVHTGIGIFLLLHYSKTGLRTTGERRGQEPVRRRLAVGTCGQGLFYILRNILESAGRLQRQHIGPAAHHRLYQMGQARSVQLLPAEFPRSDTRYVDTLSVCVEQVGI